MSCRNCKWLDVAPRKDGKIVAYKGNSYRCIVPLPEPPAMPKSVTVHMKRPSYIGGEFVVWPERGGYMQPHDGEGCSFFEVRT